MSDLQNDVSREILRRVPTESLFRLRSVCKEWCRIIDDPVFVNMHLHRPTGGDQLIIRNETGKLYSFSLNSLDYTNSRFKKIEGRNIKNVIASGVPRICGFPVGSCDGLILIPGSKEIKIWLLWNPSTGEAIKLPLCDDFKDIKGGDMLCTGLGYDCAKNDYKAVAIAADHNPDDPTLVTFIYSLNSNKWHGIEHYHDVYIWQFNRNGVYSNGALHWIADEMQQDEQGDMGCLLSLDLSAETFSKLPLPIEFSDTEEWNLDLDALGEYLFLSFSYKREEDNFMRHFDLWMVKDYSSDAWIKILSLKEGPNICKDVGIRPVAYLKSKEKVLLQKNDKELLWYDVKKKNKYAKKVKVGGILGTFSCQVFPASLVRLQRSYPVTSKKKRKRVNDRLEMKITISLGLRSLKRW